MAWGDAWRRIERPLAPLPAGATLATLRGWRPVGFDPGGRRFVVVEELRVSGRRFRPHAVGAVLPPGWTRAALPAGDRLPSAPVLPQWAYTAAGWSGGSFVVAALRTDRRRHWDPARFSGPELPGLVEARLAGDPGSRLLRQLSTCALRHRCFTAQNLFYGRDEGALPASNACNARCAGCLSDQPEGGAPASQPRIGQKAAWQELAEIGGRHLARATGRVMVSFGQGCEGEPLCAADTIERAIGEMRGATPRGSINLNTNGSLPDALDRLLHAGLDAVRISLNSADPRLYEAYYSPRSYSFSDVVRSIQFARARGAYVALNLLTFPGVTDREGEVEALADLIARRRVDQLQTRSLAIDPAAYVAIARGRGAGGEPLGLPEMARRLRQRAPWLSIGNFARALNER